MRLHKVRGEISDQQGNVALIHNPTADFFELPGGGAEKDETLQEAIAREGLEEVGCKLKASDITLIYPFDRIVSCDAFYEAQTVHVFRAICGGPIMAPQLSSREKADSVTVVWCTRLEAQQRLTSESSTQKGREIMARDIEILTRLNRQAYHDASFNYG